MDLRTKTAAAGMIGLVVIEIGMGLASNTPQINPGVQTGILVTVLATGSMLQASLLKFTLEHRARKNWRQWPIMGIQFTLFVLIAYWAHKGLGNTLFVGWSDTQLWVAGLGLGLITIFGPEVINLDYDYEDQTQTVPETTQNAPGLPVTVVPGTLSYSGVIEPPAEPLNGHEAELERAVELVSVQ